MDFYTILDQVVDLLRQRQRVTYRALQRQFALDEEALEDLTTVLFCDLVDSMPIVSTRKTCV